MDFEVDGLLELGVVADDERAEEPGSHDVVEKIGLAVLLGIRLSGTYAGEKGVRLETDACRSED